MARTAEPSQRIDSHLNRRAKLQNGLLPGLIGSHLRRAENAVFERFQRIVADFGITPSEFGILLLIHENSGLSQSELGKAIRADRSTVVALIDRFEERKMVVRKASPIDRRCHALQLTEKGEKTMQELIPRVRSHEKSVAANLSREEQAQLIDLLNRIAS
jgi:DNA-binding MarR family transcriptional regulator